MSTAWGENPCLLVCGHLADPWAGYGNRNGVSIRECFRCAREKGENERWQPVAAVAPDLDLADG